LPGRIRLIRSVSPIRQKSKNLSVKAYYCAIGCAFQGFGQKNGAAAENVLGAGGVADSPEIREFYKKHKEVTGIDADYADAGADAQQGLYGRPVAEQLLLGRRRDRLHAICSGEAEDQLGMRHSGWRSACRTPVW
jgi:hypothetical protein